MVRWFRRKFSSRIRSHYLLYTKDIRCEEDLIVCRSIGRTIVKFKLKTAIVPKQKHVEPYLKNNMLQKRHYFDTIMKVRVTNNKIF